MTSLWNATAPARSFPRLSAELSVDVAVIGGGIFGLTTAYLLKEAGKSVAVVEAGEVGAGVTGSSTGKVTSQHGPMYQDLVGRFGRDLALAYAEANQWAIEEIARIVTVNGIECDFERRDACLVAQGSAGAKRLDDEAKAVESLGLPARRAETLPTPQPLRAALVFGNQAQFHPRRYAAALAAGVDGGNSHVFERSRATDVGGGRPLRVTIDGGSLLAKDVIVATHMPFLDRGGFFARAYPRAHVGIAAPLPAEDAPQDMYFCVDGAPPSYRSWHDGERAWLIAIGGGFKPGEIDDVEGMTRKLEEEVRRFWNIGEVAHRWMAQDYHPADGQPFAGAFPLGPSHVFTATGFGAWGLTTSAVAARLVADSIVGQAPAWPGLFSTGRLGSTLTTRFFRRNAHVAQHWLAGRLAGGAGRGVSALSPGEGAILHTEDGKRAVYRDPAGSYHAFSPYCPHMQCLLSWNNLEKTWDCACHGSRFAAEGDLLHGPATQDLPPKRLP